MILQESRNPLSAGNAVASRTAFKYTSGYIISKNSTSWGNGSESSMTRGAMLLQNGHDITMDRSTLAAGRVSLTQTRQSTSDANWRLSPNLSFGGQAALSGFDRLDPGATNNEGERKSEFKFSTVTRQRPSRGFNSNFNLLAGYLNLKNFSQIKRGLSGDFNGRAHVTSATGCRTT